MTTKDVIFQSALAKDSIDSENMLCIQSVINIEK